MLQAVKPKQAKVLGWKRTDTELLIDTEHGQLRLIPYTANIVRVTYTLAPEFSTVPGLGLVPLRASCQWTLEETEETLVVSTPALKVVIGRQTCALSYFDAQGQLLTKEPDRGGKTLDAYDAYKTLLDANSVVEKIVTPDGVKEVVRDAKKAFYKTLYHTRLELEWAQDEALYGLGQHQEGSLNLRGTRQYVHQANMKVAIPFFVSTKNYAILIDTYSPLIFNDNEYGSYLYNEAAAELDFYFIIGDNFDQLIAGYRTLSGKATMLPLWAFGYMQSQERYESQQEILDTVAEYRRRQIPLDCIVLDWCSWEEGKWGQKSFDKARFPDVPAMMNTLHEQGVRLMISIWPNMHESSDNYAEMKQQGCLLPRSEIYDAFSEAARRLYWKQANEGLFSQGVDAWWCDSSEPVTPEWNTPIRPEPDKNWQQFHNDARTYLDEENTNAFSLMHSRAIYEGQKGTGSPKRVVNLTRSAYTGQQKFGTIVWSGDTSANWKTLQNQIPAGLSFCASGLPYWTLDIGGFFVKKGHMWFWDGDYEDGCQDSDYRELYTRWFQLGAFLPVFRAHGTDTRREIWNFGEKGEICYDTLVRFTELRATLIPYIYSLAAQASLEDSTMMRLLAFDFALDPRVHNIKDQFLFGPALLVCPVTSPMGETDKTRSVYLPAGADWYDFWTNEKFTGGQTIEANAELSTMPLYVRAGSVIPMTQVAPHTGAIPQNHFQVRVYPGCDGQFTLYQDDGDHHGWEKGEYTRIPLTWDDKKSVLSVGSRIGAYASMPEKVEFTVEVVGR